MRLVRGGDPGDEPTAGALVAAVSQDDLGEVVLDLPVADVAAAPRV
jgi:hypothetical protein